MENITFLHISSWTQSGEYHHILPNKLFENTNSLFRGRIVGKLIFGLLANDYNNKRIEYL